MKILFVHNFYQQAGGEDSVVAAEIALLREYGHDLEFWQVDNKDIPPGLSGKIKTAWNTAYSAASRITAARKIANFRPDIVHVHNFFPQISPSVYDACLAADVPVVQTLHNYRLICPGAMLMREGKICELCIAGSPYQAVKYGCYRDSKLGSLVLAHLVDKHRRQGTWQHKVTRFIALTEFAKQKFVEAGFPRNKIAVKPNFVPEPVLANQEPVKRSGPALYVGRISAEKGIQTLMAAWPQMGNEVLLKIAGAGPLENLLTDKHNVLALGRQNGEEISRLMQEAAFLILPSEWYEGFPMVLVEAFAHGLPVLASRLGSMANIISDGVNGLLFTAGDAMDLELKAKWMMAHPNEAKKLGENARQEYLLKYTAEKNYQQLMAIYADAIAA